MRLKDGVVGQRYAVDAMECCLVATFTATLVSVEGEVAVWDNGVTIYEPAWATTELRPVQRQGGPVAVGRDGGDDAVRRPVDALDGDGGRGGPVQLTGQRGGDQP